MMDPVDRLMATFEEVTASARVVPPNVRRRRASRLVTVLATALVVVLAVGVTFVVLNTRVPQPPVAAASPSSAPALSPVASPTIGSASAEPSSSPRPSGLRSDLLYIENRGGPALTFSIGGTGYVTANCDQQTILSANDVKQPGLPWHLSVTRDDDGSVVWQGSITQLPAWFTQIGPESLGVTYSPVEGPRGPSCPPPASRIPSPGLPSATPKPVAAGRFDGWSPDGQHLIVDALDADHLDRYAVIDTAGTELMHFRAWQVEWVDSSTIAVIGDGVTLPSSTAVLYDLTGANVGEITGDFEEFLFAPGRRVAAARSIAHGNESQGGTYQIWDGTSLSDWHQGIPVAWSPDGTRLVVVHPNGEPYRPGVAGTLAFVDASGHQVMALPNWVTGTTARQSFSPDGRYLATCLWHPGSAEELGVIDTESGDVQKVADGCGFYLDWSAYPELFLNDNAGNTPTWTSDFGGSVSSADLPSDVLFDVAGNGDIAYWSSNESGQVLNVVHEETTTPYEMPGPVSWAAWSPDGSQIAVGNSATLTFITPGSTTPAPTLNLVVEPH